MVELNLDYHVDNIIHVLRHQNGFFLGDEQSWQVC